MTPLLAILISLQPTSFYFDDLNNLYGTTTGNIPFRQIEVLKNPRIQRFDIGTSTKVGWWICEDKQGDTSIAYDMKDLSVCVSKN